MKFINNNSVSCFLILFMLTINASHAQYEPNLTIRTPDVERNIRDVNISSDGSKILISSPSPAIWNTFTGEKIIDLQEPRYSFVSSAISPNDKYAVLVGDPSYAEVFDFETGEKLYRVNQMASYERLNITYSVAFNPSSSQFLTSSNDYFYHLYDVETGELIKFFEISSIAHKMNFLNDDQVLIYTSGRQVIMSVEQEEIIYEFPDQYFKSSVSYDKKTIILNGTEDIAFYDLSNDQVVKEREFSNVNAREIGLSPSGEYFITGALRTEDGRANYARKVIRSETNEILREYPLDYTSMKSEMEYEDDMIRFFPDGKRFYTTNAGILYIYDISDLVTEIEEPAVFESNN